MSEGSAINIKEMSWEWLNFISLGFQHAFTDCKTILWHLWEWWGCLNAVLMQVGGNPGRRLSDCQRGVVLACMSRVGRDKSNLTSGYNAIRQKGVEMRVTMRVLTEECGRWGHPLWRIWCRVLWELGAEFILGGLCRPVVGPDEVQVTKVTSEECHKCGWGNRLVRMTHLRTVKACQIMCQYYDHIHNNWMFWGFGTPVQDLNQIELTSTQLLCHVDSTSICSTVCHKNDLK
jgi:hypothetical protein